MTTAGSLVASVGGSLTCRTSLTVEHLQRVKHLKLQYNCSVGQSAALQPWATAGLQAEADIDSQWPAPHPVTVPSPLSLLISCSCCSCAPPSSFSISPAPLTPPLTASLSPTPAAPQLTFSLSPAPFTPPLTVSSSPAPFIHHQQRESPPQLFLGQRQTRAVSNTFYGSEVSSIDWIFKRGEKNFISETCSRLNSNIILSFNYFNNNNERDGENNFWMIVSWL